jgi:hypothetical protein
MENYLRNLASRLLRISRASLDIGTARKLREISRELDNKADESGGEERRRGDDKTRSGSHRSH